MKIWDNYEKQYIFDHSLKLDHNNIILFKKSQTEKLHFGQSIKHPNIKTLVIPSTKGVCLIFEGKHFKIIE